MILFKSGANSNLLIGVRIFPWYALWYTYVYVHDNIHIVLYYG